MQNLVTSLPNPNPDPNLSGQVESESEKNGSDPHHWYTVNFHPMSTILGLMTMSLCYYSLVW
jgi:hypothetical protein